MRIVIIVVFILFKLLPDNLNAQYLNDTLEPELTSKVDSLINLGIQKKAFPGAQVIIFKKDSIRINKSYGYHTYDSLIPVSKNDLYDLASVTKVLASTLALMKLYELYGFNIKDPAS